MRSEVHYVVASEPDFLRQRVFQFEASVVCRNRYPHASHHMPTQDKLEVRTMALNKDLLEILVCPLDKAALELKPDQSGLKCTQCKRVYPVRDDIPVMLIDEARIEE
jgi:uncharacterized protein YbaR (Trm112 family)